MEVFQKCSKYNSDKNVQLQWLLNDVTFFLINEYSSILFNFFSKLKIELMIVNEIGNLTN